MPAMSTAALLRTVVLSSAFLALGCARGPGGFEPVAFEAVARPERPDPFPNWPVPPTEAELIMQDRPAELRLVERTEQGVGGAQRVRVFFEDIDQEVTFKLKRIPDDLDGMNNAPRKEIAAYELQKLFLEPEDYVVPTTMARCIPLERWEPFDPDDVPQIQGARCVLVVAALWLEDVTMPDVLYERERFLKDPVYARYLADFNVFSYLIEHRDTRQGNALVSKDPGRRQVFAIDNGIAFGTFPYNFFVPNWDRLRVAALRKETVERLRSLRYMELNKLQVAQQLSDDGTGLYRMVRRGSALDSRVGAEAIDGVVQLGLTKSEIDGVWQRVQKLLRRVDAGEIPLF